MAKIETTQIRRTIRRQQWREMVPMVDSTPRSVDILVAKENFRNSCASPGLPVTLEL